MEKLQFINLKIQGILVMAYFQEFPNGISSQLSIPGALIWHISTLPFTSNKYLSHLHQQASV